MQHLNFPKVRPNKRIDQSTGALVAFNSLACIWMRFRSEMLAL